MNPYMFGSFFPALAARIRVKYATYTNHIVHIQFTLWEADSSGDFDKAVHGWGTPLTDLKGFLNVPPLSNFSGQKLISLICELVINIITHK
jgi:hypothetical protein